MKILIFLFATIFSVKAVTFNCSFTNYSLVDIGIVYRCSATVSNITSRNLTAVYGTHQSGKTNADVKYLQVYNQSSVTFIPKGIENFFPNLIAIYFGHTNISTLNGDELKPFGELKWLGISENRNLERIPGNLFSLNPKIHTISFYWNNIKHVGEDLFNGIERNLKYLSFGGNYCVDQNASNNTAAISALIQHIKANCTDIEQETTSTTLTTMTTTSAPSCGEMSEIVCTLKEQNQILIENNEELKGEIQGLASDNEELKEKLEEISTEMNLKVDEMGQQLSELSQENAEMKKMLNDVLEGILELSTRPCG